MHPGLHSTIIIADVEAVSCTLHFTPAGEMYKRPVNQADGLVIILPNGVVPAVRLSPSISVQLRSTPFSGRRAQKLPPTAL